MYGWKISLKCSENGALVRATCAKQPKIGKWPRNALAQTRMKIAHWRCKNGRQKEKCDVVRENACGYTVLLSMHFGQKDMYKDAKKRSVMQMAKSRVAIVAPKPCISAKR